MTNDFHERLVDLVNDEAGAVLDRHRSKGPDFREFFIDARKYGVQTVLTGRKAADLHEPVPPWAPKPTTPWNIRAYIHTLIPHFHVCNGPRPGGHFTQENEAWVVHDMVIDHVTRLVVGEVWGSHPRP